VEEQVDIEALRRGDERAFKDLVESYQDRVFHTCFGFLGTREEAEDAAQETFIEVLSSIGSFRQEAALSTWIYRIAVITALQAIRKKRRKRQVAMLFGSERSDDALAAAHDPDENSHPLLRLENKERAEALSRALNKLPESQRVAFTLHKADGLGHKEVAEIMNLTASSVESLIHRAKANLQKHLLAYYRKQ